MPLFGSARDASFVRSISRELIHKIISTEVEVYQLSLSDTTTNIYNEARQKTYFNPIRVGCTIQNEGKTAAGDDSQLDFSRLVTFSFLRDDLVDISLVISEGDIIFWDGKYFEADVVNASQYWTQRNPDQYTPNNLQEVGEFGYSTSVRVESHQTRVTQLNIVDERTGINGLNSTNNLPKNL